MYEKIVYLWPFQLFAIGGIIYSIYSYSWIEVVILLVTGLIIGNFGEFVGLHRYFSHNAFKVNKYWHAALVLCSTLVMSGPILAWASIHRNHHKNSDTPNDPHSPLYRGQVNTFFANWWWYRYTDVKQLAEYNNDKLIRFTTDYYYLVNIGFIVLLLIVNPYLVLPLYCFPGFIGPLLSSILNTYCHRGGSAKDSPFLAWVIFGDGYHKYHHDNPKDAFLPFPDLSGAIIKCIRQQ